MTEPTSNDPNDPGIAADAAGGKPLAEPLADLTERDPAATPDDAGAEGSRGQMARDALSQLQSIIDSLATQAAPVIRDIGAKAAELAAAAAERSGPVAHRAAEMTEDAGTRIASKAREVAADLRRNGDSAGRETAEATSDDEPDTGIVDQPLDRPDTPGQP